MKLAEPEFHLDSSVLVAALDEDEKQHLACRKMLLRSPRCCAWTHALAETYSTLTGGRLAQRMSPEAAAQLIEESIIPNLRLVEMDGMDFQDAFRQARSAGVRGGAIYDFLHLRAAAKAGAKQLITLNVRHFVAFTRPGDPAIQAP